MDHDTLVLFLIMSIQMAFGLTGIAMIISQLFEARKIKNDWYEYGEPISFWKAYKKAYDNSCHRDY